MARSLATGAIALLFLYSAATGAVLRVEKDGSGDYTAIQPAVDSASPGDTILVGPGRYTEHQVFWPSEYVSFDTYVAVTVDSLTIMGTNRDSVIIGPEVPNFVGFDPNGMLTSVTLTKLTVSTVTIENVYGGIYSAIGTLVDNCTFRGCGNGIMSDCRGGLTVRNCRFVSSVHDGICVFDETPVSLIEGNIFDQCTYGIAVIGAQNIVVRDCDFQGGAAGVQYERGATGTVTHCRLVGQAVSGIIIYTGAEVFVDDNYISGCQASIHVGGFGARVTGERNILRGGSYATVLVETGMVELHNNHIFYDGRYLVQAEAFVNPPDVTLDLQNNYWGIADRDSIAGLIYDGNDDPNVHAFVDFEPYSITPLPAQHRSLGSVKNLYR